MVHLNREEFKGKLLFFDIETSLLEVYTHHLGQQYINLPALKKDKKIVCISYKAEGWEKPRTIRWKMSEEASEALQEARSMLQGGEHKGYLIKALQDALAAEYDDKEMLEQFAAIAGKYDVLVGQNGDNFDIKMLKGRLWVQGLKPMTNIISLDTLKMSRRDMRLTSHKLDYKLQVIGQGGKIKTDFDLWKNVQKGNHKALSEMCRYCEGDVNGLQDVFWSLLPYCSRLPVALGVLLTGDREACPKCGEKDRMKNGTRPSAAGLKQRWVCRPCGYDWTDTRQKSSTDQLNED